MVCRKEGCEFSGDNCYDWLVQASMLKETVVDSVAVVMGPERPMPEIWSAVNMGRAMIW